MSIRFFAALLTAVLPQRQAASRRASIFTLLLLALAIAGEAQAALDFSVGPKELIYSTSQRKSKKLAHWPDGSMGVVANGDGTYDFYGPNSSSPVKTTGSLADPGRTKKSVKINGIPKRTYSYASGGPVYEDPTTGMRLMIYHAEDHRGGKKQYHSVLGLAASTDPNGLVFQDLGTIIEPNSFFGPTGGSVDVGGGSFAVFDDHVHVYYRDYLTDGTSSQLAVARAPLADVVSNALNGVGTDFTKYYNGAWSQSGRRGLSSPLEIGNPANFWSAVSYNEYLDQVVMVSSQWQAGGTGPDLYLATSPDGVTWSPRQPVAIDFGEQMYPTIIGTGADPTVTGQSFYVYYTDSRKGSWNRWKDAQLARRQLTFNSLVPPGDTDPIPLPSPTPGPGPTPGPPPTSWMAVAEYQADFQTGTPADGWTYAWNPTGTLGDSDAFAPLLWSDTTQVYNTTGGETTRPGKKRHNDDFLMLYGDGGHPGLPGYMPIAGYTIQPDDDGGLYRIAASTIQKIDSIVSKYEDGLEVRVYVNDMLLGTPQYVSPTGQLTNFDRELGQLSVGDTVWVVVSPYSNQAYDRFTNFNFTIEKSVPLLQLALNAATVVPEPGSAALLTVALLLLGPGQRFRARR